MDKATIDRLTADIPNAIGVYFLYDINDTLIYVGKSIAIRKGLLQHFRSPEYREQRIQQATVRISYEIMGSELIALLHESDLIKIHKPRFNRAQRRTVYAYGLYADLDDKGYSALTVRKLDAAREELMTFSSLNEGKDFVYRITEKYALCQKINGLYPTKGACFQYQLKMCFGACIQEEPTTTYNMRVQQFVETTKLPQGELFIPLQGRDTTEKGIVYLKNGHYRGFGFCKKSTRSTKVMLQAIMLKAENKDSRRILKRYLNTMKQLD